MSLRALALLALLSSGCVPVTEPVGDIDKAEPDKNLGGTWVSTKNKSDVLRIETQEVKGLPKGLMTMTALGTDPEREPMWMFVSAVGKACRIQRLQMWPRGVCTDRAKPWPSAR